MLSIRPALPSDARALSVLAEETFRTTFGAFNTVENMDLHCRQTYSEEIQAREIADPNRLTLLAEEAGQFAGFTQLRWGATPSCIRAQAPGEIQRLYVRTAWHGRGVAQALLAASDRALLDRGCDVAWLGVWEHNPRAIAFYRKLGFREAGEQTFPLGHDPQRDLVMVRPVERGAETKVEGYPAAFPPLPAGPDVT